MQPAARILHLEGLKQHQVRNLQQLKQRWQHTLDTEQPPEGMPWLLQPDGEAMAQCDQRGWVPLVLRDDWPQAWLMEHLTGPLLPEIALVGEPPTGAAIPEGGLQVAQASQLP